MIMSPEVYDMPHFAPVAGLMIGVPMKSRADRRKSRGLFEKRGPKQQLPKRRKYHKGGHNKK